MITQLQGYEIKKGNNVNFPYSHSLFFYEVKTMGLQGLGENSPVQLSLSRENYEALIGRHGQFVRWRQAQKCTCIDKNTFAPNIRCSKCGGRGFTYDYQKTADNVQTVMAWDNTGILEVDSQYEDAELLKVWDFSGNEIPAEKTGVYVKMLTSPIKGQYYNILMRDPLTVTIKKAKTTHVGAGYYRVEGLKVRRSGIDGIFYTSPCDILNIGKIIDGNGVEYKAVELRQDSFLIEPGVIKNEEGNEEIQPIADPVLVEDVEYIKPSVFALLSQNLNKADAQMVAEANGDAVLTFPYSHDVAENDVVTVLSGTITKKETVNKIKNKFDTLSAFFVESVPKCMGKEREFIQGKDFLLVGTNRIKWICEDAPKDGETYSITYRVFPTYVVMKNIPQLRSSEDQRMPKKAVVKYFNSYSEMTKVNRQ
ncbi:MAG: hypothetical protein MJ176_03345 [Treponema sp.]|nr:hypothetical protein [Treponema sp.]